MARGPLGGMRPGAKSTLQLVIRKTPVPESEPVSVFPESLMKDGASKSDIKEDITERTGFGTQRVNVSTSISQLRGLGQSTTFTIDVDVSGKTPMEVSDMVEQLTSVGYQFDSVEFK